MREITATYCDYCGAELTNTAHSSIEYKDGVIKDFCSTHTRDIEKTCLEKYKEEERTDRFNFGALG